MTNPVWFGYNQPFVSGAGVMPLQADERIVKNDLLQLLLTSPGERVMRPNFGSPINNYLFELGDPDSLQNLRSDIIAVILAEEKRIVLYDVIVQANSSDLQIKIIASLKLTPDVQFELDVGITPNV